METEQYCSFYNLCFSLGLNESFGNLSLLETTQDVNGGDEISSENVSPSTSMQIPSVTFLGDTNEEVISEVLSAVNVTQGSSFLVLPTDEILVLNNLDFTASNNNEERAAGLSDKEPEDGPNSEVPNAEQNNEDYDFDQNGEVPHDDPNHQDPNYEATDDEAYPKPRSSKPDTWKRNKVKKLRDAGLAHVSLKGKQQQARSMSNGCNDTCKRKCHFTFNEDVRQNIFNNFWAIGDHTKQWYFIASHVQSSNVKRRTVVLDPSETARRQFSYFYYLPLDGAEKPVCCSFFLGTLGINSKWVRTAMAKQKTNHGVVPDDRRGKNKKPNVVSTVIRKDIMDHIKKFKTVEGHYTRKDSKSRYLPESLNVRKMHSMYLIEKQAANITTNVATLRQYRDTFRKEFNLKFFKPKKDQCPRCLSWKNKTPREKTEERKLKFEKHLSDKKLADDLKRADIQKITDSPDQMKDVCILTCDLEKVLLCPKGLNGDFYYSSKISVYNFTIFVSGEQKGCCYVWDQTEARRGAAEIASSLWSFIKKKVEVGVKEFHIYSDNCSAQNKNQFLFSMYVMASIRFNIKIIHRYLEVGHTHMEVDSMHACIENSVRYTDIFVPSQWYTAIRLAKKKPPMYEVKELTQEGIFDFKPLADLQRWDKVGTSLFKEVCMDGASPGIVRFKKEYEQEYTSVNVFKRQAGRPVNWKTIPLQKKYTAKIPPREIELKDLRELCRSGAIPTCYHKYYLETLPAIALEGVEPPPPPVLDEVEFSSSEDESDSESETDEED